MEALWAAGASVQAHDPVAMEARRLYGEQRPDLRLCASPLQALEGADALAIVTGMEVSRAGLCAHGGAPATAPCLTGATSTRLRCPRATGCTMCRSGGPALRRRGRRPQVQ